MLAARRGRVGNGEAEAGSAVGGQQVEPAVALRPRGWQRTSSAWVSTGTRAPSPCKSAIQTLSRRAVPTLRGHEAASGRRSESVDAVVGVLAERSGSGVRILAVEAGAVDQHVGVGRGADPVAPDPAVEGLLTRSGPGPG